MQGFNVRCFAALKACGHSAAALVVLHVVWPCTPTWGLVHLPGL